MTHKPTLRPSSKQPATVVSFDWLVRLPAPKPQPLKPKGGAK